MFAAIPMFFGAEQFAAFGIKCLAVGGAFLAGYVLGGIVVFALNKWLFAEKAPDILKKSIKVLAGIALAILVAMIVFGDGSGGGLFGGGANGSGKGTPDADSHSKDKGDKTPPVTQPTPKEPPKVVVPNKGADLKPDDPRVRVTFLGGDVVQGDRYYLINDDPLEKAKSFEDLKRVVEAQKKGETRQMYLVVQFPDDHTIAADENSLTVKQVIAWARDAMGLKVVLPEKK
jgi:hypothetical protein